MKLLLVEDEQSLGTTLSALLKKQGYDVLLARTKQAACDYISTNNFDLAILDVGLPDGDGFEVASEIRKATRPQFNSQIPIIFLTAMNTAEYRLKGFEIGADDYIPKPFHMRELLLRLAKFKPQLESLSQIKVSNVIIDLDNGSITTPDKQTKYLGRADLLVLKALISNAPKIVSRDEILNYVSLELAGINTGLSNARSIDNSVVRLRQLLADAKQECIRAVRGLGYQWAIKIANDHN